MENFKEDGEEKALLKAKTDALRLLSVRPRSVEELCKRLKLKRHTADIINKVMDLLKKQGLVDDEKFAKLYAESRVYSKPSGRKQLEFDLKRKGLSRDLVSKTLSNLSDYDEKKAAKDLVAKRFERMSGVPAEKKKGRIYGFLKRRGFGNEVIFSVMEELFKGAAEEGLE